MLHRGPDDTQILRVKPESLLVWADVLVCAQQVTALSRSWQAGVSWGILAAGVDLAGGAADICFCLGHQL